MIQKAYAKINLTLDVLNRRTDGYHNVKMIMQAIDLYDEITVELLEKEGIVITSDSPFVPCDETNIAYKAARLMLQRADSKSGVSVHISKRIPVCAGLAGGSTDGAAVIVALNSLLGLGLSKSELMEISAPLGADVPFCIMGGTALAEDIGTVLTALPSFRESVVLLVKPPINVSTPWAYKNLKLDGVTHPDVDGMIKCLETGDYGNFYSCMGNVLETVTVPEYPIISRIKKDMLELGAEFSMMSGSGPTVFGFFSDIASAEKAAQSFEKKFDEVIISKTV